MKSYNLQPKKNPKKMRVLVRNFCLFSKFQGILGDFFAHKYPLYRACIGIFHKDFDSVNES